MSTEKTTVIGLIVLVLLISMALTFIKNIRFVLMDFIDIMAVLGAILILFVLSVPKKHSHEKTRSPDDT